VCNLRLNGVAWEARSAPQRCKVQSPRARAMAAAGRISWWEGAELSMVLHGSEGVARGLAAERAEGEWSRSWQGAQRPVSAGATVSTLQPGTT
jgi:hypothetical protein